MTVNLTLNYFTDIQDLDYDRKKNVNPRKSLFIK